jgi:integrase/recombinase XerD
LPKLSTYLGHVHISGTQRYLTLTPELLREAV